MKTLLLARHAKSSWDAPEDFQRTLSERGQKDVNIMAQYLSECGYLLHQIITSDALRAQATAEVYEAKLKPSHRLITHHDLYLATADDIVNIARNITASMSTVMLVGHNPGMHEVLNDFVVDKIEDMPSCSVAIIQFDVTGWADISQHNASLLAFEYPKKNQV